MVSTIPAARCCGGSSSCCFNVCSKSTGSGIQSTTGSTTSPTADAGLTFRDVSSACACAAEERTSATCGPDTPGKLKASERERAAAWFWSTRLTQYAWLTPWSQAVPPTSISPSSSYSSSSSSSSSQSSHYIVPGIIPSTGLPWSQFFMLLAVVSALSALATHHVCLYLAPAPPAPCASTANAGGAGGARRGWETACSSSSRSSRSGGGSGSSWGAASSVVSSRVWRTANERLVLLSARPSGGVGAGGINVNGGAAAATAAAAGGGGREPMVVLVTGAAGFVGSHLALALKARGDGVVGLDNFNGYYDPSLKRARQARLRAAGVYVVEGDINDGELLMWLLARVAFTHVAHMAAQAGVRYALENPLSYVRSNVAGFVTLLEACRKVAQGPESGHGGSGRRWRRPPAVVWASSSSVYGTNRRLPFSEEQRTDAPASLYAATKKAGEGIAHVYSNIYGLSLTALRFFTVYGPWGRPDMAYFSFTRDILAGRPVKIFSPRKKGQAQVARDFTFIDDVVAGCLGALDTAPPSAGGHEAVRNGRKQAKHHAPRVFNLGNTHPVPVADMVALLERHLGVPAVRQVERMPLNGDVAMTHANVTAARTALGYEPHTSLDEGLGRFVAWYKEYYNVTEGAVKAIQ